MIKCMPQQLESWMLKITSDFFRMVDPKFVTFTSSLTKSQSLHGKYPLLLGKVGIPPGSTHTSSKPLEVFQIRVILRDVMLRDLSDRIPSYKPIAVWIIAAGHTSTSRAMGLFF